MDKLGGDTTSTEQLELEDIEFQTPEEITDELFADDNHFYVEMLDDNYHYADIIGFSIVNEKGYYYLPTELALQSESFKKWAEDESKKKTVYDAKRSEVSLRRHGIHLKGVNFDTLMASYIINPTEYIDDLSTIAKKYGITNIQSDESFYGKGAKRKIPEGLTSWLSTLFEKVWLCLI